MSWDVILVSGDVADIEQMDAQGAPVLGSKSKVIRQLKEVFPDLDLSDPTWGLVIRPKYSIEFNIGEEEPMVTLFLHIRGGEEVIGALGAICAAASWRAYDTTTGLFIDFENDPSRGLKIWQNYRNQVVAQMSTKGEPVTNLGDYAFIIKKKKPWWQFWK